LREHTAEIEQLGLNVAAVTFETPRQAQEYVAQTALPWPLLIDLDRRLYQAYGMQRGAAWRILGPRSWLGYMKILLRGRRPHMPTDDIYQLGGDILIDPTGIIRLHYVSQTPVDRPNVNQILALITPS
jgi:hypothetical protein